MIILFHNKQPEFNASALRLRLFWVAADAG